MFNLLETHGSRRPQGLGEAHADLTTLGLWSLPAADVALAGALYEA
jgi:hypothetical protein